MSGIVGIFHQDGSPVDAALVQRLTDFLAFRGPDDLGIWIEGAVGFGHTLFRTSEEARNERQPFSLDGKIWIVADARLDARADLIEKLQDQPAQALREATDAELILRGYGAWGERCVEHFLGDFAFGIWDRARQRLFCARDQMGVKPFYYAHLGAVVVFSNTLECIRRHPGVSDRLNELAIADFLLLQHNQDPATTSFTDIARLPAAHTASFSAADTSTGDKCVQRYWTMPVDPLLRLRRPDDYTERFKELLWQVVGDRLRSCTAGLFLSGGLDSTTMAAGAAKVLRERCADGGKLVALTMADAANPTEEEHAALAAKALGIPIHFFRWDDGTVDPAWESTPALTPEPALGPWDLATTRRYYAQAAALNRVFLHGEGPDHALHFEWQPYASHLLAAGEYGRLFREVAKTMMCNRRVPISVRGPALIAQRRARVHSGGGSPTFPHWLNPNLESRFGVRARWDACWAQSRGRNSAHPIRPVAYASLDDGFWRTLFERQDCGWTGALVEVREPLADVRMLRFLLSVPPLPWCRAKYLLRRAMRGVLPRRVLRRAKWALTSDILIKRIFGAGLAPLAPEPELADFVEVRRFPAAASSHLWLFGCEMRVRLLNHWLKYRSRDAVRQV